MHQNLTFTSDVLVTSIKVSTVPAEYVYVSKFELEEFTEAIAE